MKKNPNYFYFVVAIVVVILCFVFAYRRHIYIHFLFAIYDLLSLYGLYWRMDIEHCSPMKEGFVPVMPLEYYGECNKELFPRISSGNNKLHRERIISICDRNLEWLQTYAQPVIHPQQVTVVRWNETETISRLLQKDVPFVIRGMELQCFTTMQLNHMIEMAGNKKVYMSKCPENEFVELHKILSEKKQCYISNSTNLFHFYPELFPDSDVEKIKEAIGGGMECNSKQLFVGTREGTGTAMHAAYTNNFFLMIQGRKKWTFFNPNQLALLYPHFTKSGIYMVSESDFQNMQTQYHEMKKRFPLLTYAHRYEIELEEKDILYNPMSWFHAVYNTTEISVGCSTRWSKSFFTFPDVHMLRYGNLTNPELRDYVKEIYIQNGVLGIAQIDEHKHMIGEKNPDAIPYWDKNTNNLHNLCKDENCSLHWHRPGP
jgi:Cupin-like domain